MAESDADILKEITDKFAEWTDLWQPIRDEGTKDILCIAGKPWEALDPEGQKQRTKHNRPMLALDELNQYSNQLINDALSHPRAVKVAPRGFGANDQTAALRADKIREIEYRSNSPMIYATMFQNTVERSYGFARVNAKWEPGLWKQEVWLEPLMNPDLITPDPWALHPDGSDMKGCFEHEWRDRSDFEKGGEFSGATIASFDTDGAKTNSWIRGTKIQVANYWKVKTVKKTLLALKHPTDPNGEAVPMWEDDIPKDELRTLQAEGAILREREDDAPAVCVYLSNGVEILDYKEWPGKHIPIVTCYGKILYVDEGAGSERQMLSLIRLARDPYMLYCYYRTQQAEMAGMIPKVPVMAYKGQFAGMEYDWQRAPHEPLAFIEANALTEATGDQILPLPTRLAYEAGAHLQALELCSEGARRAIQAAMGAYALPTTAQRHNEKSGVALQQIKENTQIGNFHFMDHYNDSIRRAGVVMNDLLPHVHDMPGPITVRTLDGKTETRHVSTQERAIPNGVRLDTGEHDITISTGPSLDSQREEANQLADALIGSSEVLQIIGPQKAVKLLAMAVKMRNPGPSGELMASIIDPPNDQSQNPALLGQQLQMTQQHLQQVTQAATLMKQALDAKLIEQQGKIKVTEIQEIAESQRSAADREVKLAVAELTAKVTRMELFMEERARLGTQAHDVATNAADAGHEQMMADQQHQQELAAADQAHQQTMQQTQQAADLQPPPAEPATA